MKSARRIPQYFSQFSVQCRSLARDTSGATAIEYGLIVVGIFLAIVGAVNYYIDKVGNMYNDIANNM